MRGVILKAEAGKRVRSSGGASSIPMSDGCLAR